LALFVACGGKEGTNSGPAIQSKEDPQVPLSSSNSQDSIDDSALNGVWQFVNTGCFIKTNKIFRTTTAISIFGKKGFAEVTEFGQAAVDARTLRDYACTYYQELEFEYPEKDNIDILVVGKVTADSKNGQPCETAAEVRHVYSVYYEGLHGFKFKKDALLLENHSMRCVHKLLPKNKAEK
jgi:hypothetical protein